MGIADHDAALKPAQDAFDAFTTEVLADPGLSAEEKDAIFTLQTKVLAQVEDAAGKLEKGLKVGKMAHDLFKDPLAMLGRVGGLLGL